MLKQVEEVRADVTTNMVKMNSKLDASLDMVEKIVSGGKHILFLQSFFVPFSLRLCVVPAFSLFAL